MASDLLQLLSISFLISLTSFGGGAKALFYQFGVQQTHWVSSTDLSAVFAFGFATPGPAVFGTATFIGYKVAGFPGALISTIGVYVLPFTLAFLAAKYLSHLIHNKHASGFIRGIGLAGAGVAAAVAVGLFTAQSVNIALVIIAAFAFIASKKYRINPLIILLSGLFAGLLFSL